MTMKASKVYRKTAERVCRTKNNREGYSMPCALFDAWCINHDAPFRDIGIISMTPVPHLTLALCFMAAIAEDEERGKRRGSL